MNKCETGPAKGVGEDALNPVGVATTGVLQIQRTPGITGAAVQKLTLTKVIKQSRKKKR
jgi:hypothetical protein